MSKFNKGDKVRVVTGTHSGLSGVVTDPWWQISQSDWPSVEFRKDDGMLSYADEADMELTEDPYEYAIMQTRISDNYDYTTRLLWGTLAEAQDELSLMSGKGGSGFFSYRIVKRRKAGPIEGCHLRTTASGTT